MTVTKLKSYKVKSRTTPDKYYTLNLFNNGVVTCDCKGFQVRKTCWHSEKLKAVIKKKKQEMVVEKKVMPTPFGDVEAF